MSRQSWLSRVSNSSMSRYTGLSRICGSVSEHLDFDRRSIERSERDCFEQCLEPAYGCECEPARFDYSAMVAMGLSGSDCHDGAWAGWRAQMIGAGIGQVAPITGTICQPWPDCVLPGGSSGGGNGGSSSGSAGGTGGQGTVGTGGTGIIPFPGSPVFTFPGDLCPQLLGQSAIAQAICKSNFSFCGFLCNLFGQGNNPASLNTCIQTYCPIVFVGALIASGLVVYKLLLSPR